jgi:phosphopantothenoylcysteine decarboxylase / phosphopantothenate---cysteine ligase
MVLENKKILIGVSGGIAAYKVCELVRLFKKNGAGVRLILTPSAVKFVSPITLSALSGNEVLINLFPESNPESADKVDAKTWHIYTGMWADVFVLAPATANTIAKIAYGMSDNFLTASVLASRCPVIVVPSMDEDMYINEITAANISRLKEFGYFVMQPEAGELASGLFGIGRMPEPQTIYDYTVKFLGKFNRDLSGKNVLVTAGPTYEPIDDVRFIGNYSTGKMGFQIARAASHRGAEVTLISGPSALLTPKNVRRIDVKTSDEMFEAVKANYTGCDFVIMSAAVADYKPTTVEAGKIKKNVQKNLSIDVSRTVDILEYVGSHKNGCKLAGFALETENAMEFAKEKLLKKNLDLIVINNPRDAGAGFGTDTNLVTLLDKDLKATRLSLMPKYDVANVILDALNR